MTTRPAKRLGLTIAAVAVLIAGAFIFNAVNGGSASALTESEKSEIKEMVRDYLVENPEILAEMIAALETKRAGDEQAAAQKSIVENRDMLFGDHPIYVAGNPEGNITLVEFFDYRCGYCKRAVADLKKLIDENPELRVLFRDYPVLGPESLKAARVAIAAGMQGRYADYHFALMGHSEPVTEELLYSVADEIGLDMAKLRTDVDSEEVDAILQENFELADKLGINGTPNFIIGDQMLPGAVGYDRMSEILATVQEEGCAVC